MKVKTSELIGPALDWAVAKCQNARFAPVWGLGAVVEASGLWLNDRPYVLRVHWDKWAKACESGHAFGAGVGIWAPSTNPALGHPIIERERIELGWTTEGWYANMYWRDLDAVPGGEAGESFRCGGDGPTILIAGLRCYVASKLGDEADVPEELLK